MGSKISSIITGTGKYIPNKLIKNSDFINHAFYEKDGTIAKRNMFDVIQKFQAITDIEERRYAEDDQNASELAYLAAKDALESANEDKEKLDYIIVAHNFGDVNHGDNRTDMVPTLASRVKYKLGIENPDCVAYDLPFGCPGWLQGMIQADYFIKSGDAKKVMVIGSETLSRVIDPHDKDSMIYSDGAGATILSASKDNGAGILSHKSQTHTLNQAWFLKMEGSSKPDYESKEDLYLKMDGRKVYEYGLTHVPLVMKTTVEKAGILPEKIKKVFVHQANGKMDDAILKRFFKLYDYDCPPENIMPMSISKLGNSSVATIPTLLDMVLKEEMENQTVKIGDVVIFASVGAGMNINAMIYRF
ncbi:ketoacyl-ACP synthase III [Pedobacter sp. SD-b]|uniref:Ketoacyl-ACP synthase III n=1 Tax=Pedobacter segetis TaxID=2793069 RepID=A0ABS1BLE7_9SPHI|nr:ketoacyl-ACP synthase III [Pedobacter segetis]MBK0383720.1 ketoacyl-ACP synthase III [Pedobacter segetis]